VREVFLDAGQGSCPAYNMKEKKLRKDFTKEDRNNMPLYTIGIALSSCPRLPVKKMGLKKISEKAG
jgi:hypothetical protein